MTIRKKGRQLKDIVGNVYGSLTIIKFAYRQSNGHSVWTCECECGVIKDIADTPLKNGKTTSCGCLRRTAVDKYTYGSWSNMVDRCININNANYYNYGGRGILLYDKWKTYAGFLEDMGLRKENESIERLDVNGNYEPSNCVWLDKSLQGYNKRTTVWIVIDDIKIMFERSL
jgi:hypothetical protein